MTAGEVVRYLAVWGLVGCAAFSIYVVAVFRSGFVYLARDRSGELKRRMPAVGYLAMLSTLAGIVGLILLADWASLARRGNALGFWRLWGLHYGLYLLWFAFDTAVIDHLVLAVWRPAWLRIPDEMGDESMGSHIARSLPVGAVGGLIITLVVTLASRWLVFAG